MIGYGPDHDSTILQQMCGQFPKSKQWFIDEVEKTGCIFGEILWSADGRRIGRVERVRGSTVAVVADMKMVYVPLDTVSASDRGLVSTLTRKEITRL